MRKASYSTYKEALLNEVGNANNDEEMYYLMDRYSFSQGTAKKLVDCVGGRLGYLEYPWDLNWVKDKSFNSNDICQAVTTALFLLGMHQEKLCIHKRWPESSKILCNIINNGSMSPKDLYTMDKTLGWLVQRHDQC